MVDSRETTAGERNIFKPVATNGGSLQSASWCEAPWMSQYQYPIRSGPGTARRRQRMGARGPSLLWADICPANARQQSDRAGGERVVGGVTAACCKAVRFCSRAR